MNECCRLAVSRAKANDEKNSGETNARLVKKIAELNEEILKLKAEIQERDAKELRGI